MFLHTYYGIILASISAFIIVAAIIPTIVYVSKAKKLFDEPGRRKAHKVFIPTLGGIAIFAAVIVSSGIFADFTLNKEFQYLTAASVILFFIGLKDDILIIAPLKKLYGQIIACLLIVILGDLRLTSLHNFLGISEIPYFISVILTIFVFIVIINGFNLIDGIDGLASGIGILCSLTFGIFFMVNGYYDYAVFSACLAGALIAFFIFNVFGKGNKIFMGDTGSLLLGFFVAVMTIKFNEINLLPSMNFTVCAAPAVSFGILIIPLFDTMRVFIIRIVNGRSPFIADNNHVHHRLLALGWSHLLSTIYITIVNLFVILSVFIFNTCSIVTLMLINLGMASFLTLLPDFLFTQREKKHHPQK